jgi:hypothetical protein
VVFCLDTVVTQEALLVGQELTDTMAQVLDAECQSLDTEQATAADSPEDLR